jgi:hypothetical protein
MLKIIDKMIYREGDGGAQAGGTGIPPAPAVTAEPGAAVVGESASAAGIPPAPTPTAETTAVAEADDDGTQEGEWWNTPTGLDDIPDVSDGPAPDAAMATPEAVGEAPQAVDDPAPPVAADAPDATPADAPLPEVAVNAIKAAAEALGIRETDPAKLPEAIEARKAEIAAESTRQREAEELAFEQRTVESLQERARQDVVALMNPVIRGELRNEGHDIDNAPDNWWDVRSPNHNPEMTARYNQLFNELRVQPQYEKAYVDAYTAHKSAYDGEKAKFAEFSNKYPNHAADLVSDLRRAGVSAEGLERFARLTDEHFNRATATNNSAIAAKDTELTNLRAQVSGHTDALAKARAEGLAEGRNAALAELRKGQTQTPGTVGVGGTATAPSAIDWSKPVTFDDIPYVSQN